ncbi:MAG: 3-dehydroquinate synthase, partial [Candidatus Eremiobacteraeota bacterium]|nr:3-dehydroquinate synthase [Candidatus Eremiobacteraeota bacterium]
MAAQEEDRDLIVNTDLTYPVCIGYDTTPAIATFMEHRVQPFIVLSDANPDVMKLARTIARFRGCLGLVDVVLGESRKRLATLERVHEALLAAGADRGTLVLGVGGGVASDLFGFAAATYMRGVPYVHVATTLVAMVDAAIGGKTGVDLKDGKNISGLFVDPVAVF